MPPVPCFVVVFCGAPCSACQTHGLFGGITGMLITKRTKITMKPPPQSPSAPVSNLMFEGVYNNARMLHFLTAVVGSTCDVRVKNGSVYEGVFKTLSSECELAVDAVHKLSDGGGVVDEGGGAPGRLQVEDITDTMVFSPSDLVTMTCRDVDLSFAVRDSFSDPSISSARLNGNHREKVLQRWDEDGNGENYELESETSNGWDANDMFKFNEDTYGVKSTYDSSLSLYTMPLERGNTEVFRQREARAARLANEIESSAQYRRRVSLENDEGRSDEDKYSAVVRERDDGGGASTRDGKYVALPQRTWDVMRGGASGRPSAPPTSSPKVASDRSSPLSVRPASSSPPCISHALPHSLSHPQALNDSSHSHVNGVSSRTSPQSHRPQLNRTQNHRTLVSPAGPDSDLSDRTSGPVPASLTCLVVPSASHAPKLDVPPHLDSSPSVTMVTSSLSGPAPLFPIDVNEILNSASKDRTGSGSGPQEGKNSRVPLVQQRSRLEELRKFGKEFRLQSSLSSVDPPPPPPDAASPPKPFDLQPSAEMAPPTSLPAAAVTPPSSGSEVSQSRNPQSASLSSDESSLEMNERTEAAATHVKNSTLNPNAKEFQPVKGHSTVKSALAPPPPRPTPPSPSVVLNSSPPAGQPGGGAIYSGPPGPYLSYMSPLSLQGHSIQGQLYQYSVSTVTQGKYPRPKGAVVSSRPDHAPSSIISVASAGPPLVSPYPQSYLQYGQVIQTVAPPYHGQTVYSMLHGGARLLTSGAPPPQPMGPSQQYPGPAEGPGGPQQGLYAAQSFSHHSGAIHHPQPSTTPTGTQAPPQHPAPSPGHSQTGQAPPPSMFHSGPLSAPTPPGHASYPVQGYSLNPHQTLAHGFTSISQITQAHVSAGLSGPHHPTGHGHPPVMLHYAPPQQAGGSTPQQGAPQHFYIGSHQAVQVQTHPSQTLTFHPSTN